MLSADVNSCLDPMFPEVSEKDNASFLGYGVNLTKYGGSRGKAGSNDANAEFLQKVRKIFNDARSLRPAVQGGRLRNVPGVQGIL